MGFDARGIVFHLLNLIHLELAFPRFEHDLDTPTQGMDLRYLFSREDRRGDIGHKNIPAQEFEISGIVIFAQIAIAASLAPTLRSDFWRDRLRNKSHGHFFLSADTDHLIQLVMVAKRFEQTKRRLAIGFKDGNAIAKATQEKNAIHKHLFQHGQRKVSQITKN